MSDNDQVTIWGGIPRFGTTPTTGQAISGGGNGFVIYDSASDNTAVVPAANTPLPNKNMELAQKTVAGVTTQYYGFAGYCASYYLDATQANASATNIVSSYKSSIQYGIHLTGGSSTRLTVYNAGVYKVSGSLNFNCSSAAGSVSVSGGFDWPTVVLESTVDVWIKKKITIDEDWELAGQKVFFDNRIPDYIIDVKKKSPYFRGFILVHYVG